MSVYTVEGSWKSEIGYREECSLLNIFIYD